MEKSDALPQLLQLIRQHRWAALSSIDHKQLPAASMVAYVLEADHKALHKGLLLHLSRLATHTGNLIRQPECALVISENDGGTGDPQELERVSLRGRVEIIERDTEDYQQSAKLYLQQLPDAEQLFEFSDFMLFRFVPENLRYVGGFANAHSFRWEELRMG
ncbi:MAG: pyridoxamine 5'-phosphate oxidase family protein [Gammaproteobacteria bacterium]|nr:pyridoxamine 5'-phosphate oxidase family protein [Gammaproteobacteria bacterium]